MRVHFFLFSLKCFPLSHSPLPPFNLSVESSQFAPASRADCRLSIPLHCQSPFFYSNLYSEKSSLHLIWRQRNFPESHFSLPTQCCLTCCLFLPCTTTFVCISAYTGGLQGIAVFPLISSTSKRSQHYFCCQLCLCDRLWTIWMSLQLAAIKAPQFRTPPSQTVNSSWSRACLSRETSAATEIPNHLPKPHPHLSRTPGSRGDASEQSEGWYVLSQIESLPNKLQQLTRIILKEQTQTVFRVMYQRKVTDRERMLKKKVVTSIMLKRNRNCHFLHVSFICNSPQGGNLFHQGRSEFVSRQQMKSQSSSSSRKIWWGWSRAVRGYWEIQVQQCLVWGRFHSK